MRLIEHVRGLVDRGLALVAATEPAHAALLEARASLDGPLKVAVAGRTKAGKSTLVNALIGDHVAPTDAGECTQIVTWYRGGLTYRVEGVVGSERRPLGFRRDGGALDIDLGSLGANDLDRLEIEWPAPILRSHTIIDTPGLGSIRAETSDRTLSFLTPQDERVTEADAVLYLMRHVHRADADFLESFHDEEVSHAAPVNAIAVLSRADEIGAGRLDAMQSARRIAAGYADDRNLRRLCSTVVPVAGLLAQAGAALRESEYAAFASLAHLPVEVREPLLWSSDRFVAPDSTDALTGEERRYLVDQFGLFGVRLAVDLIGSREVTSASGLSERLIAESGIGELRSVLERSFMARRDVLIARSVLLRLDALVGVEAALSPLASEVERVRSGAHELTEARCLNGLRSGAVALAPERLDELERLFGAEGVDPRTRLGLDVDSSDAQVKHAAMQVLERNQRHAESSLASHDARELARVAVRTCEGLLAAPF